MIEVSIDKRLFQQIETFLTICKERFFYLSAWKATFRVEEEKSKFFSISSKYLKYRSMGMGNCSYLRILIKIVL
jgi:hypothetical protein